ncbi:uncharacterized protein A4U43_C04F35390 [Asparagus officinalis]|uniref:Uncharacterized protein n=1 Tax=Asparagus officinalis TaxID=4686 RepID=A0A5P1FB83_ASPOF|nr:uncharacterized protein A4U43_C04F35390 [Asparagus officinalis]
MGLQRLREAGRGELVEGLRLKAGQESDCRWRSVRGSSTSLGDNWSRVFGVGEKLVEGSLSRVLGVDALVETRRRELERRGRESSGGNLGISNWESSSSLIHLSIALNVIEYAIYLE